MNKGYQEKQHTVFFSNLDQRILLGGHPIPVEPSIITSGMQVTVVPTTMKSGKHRCAIRLHIQTVHFPPTVLQEKSGFSSPTPRGGEGFNVTSNLWIANLSRWNRVFQTDSSPCPITWLWVGSQFVQQVAINTCYRYFRLSQVVLPNLILDKW